MTWEICLAHELAPLTCLAQVCFVLSEYVRIDVKVIDFVDTQDVFITKIKTELYKGASRGVLGQLLITNVTFLPVLLCICGYYCTIALITYICSLLICV